MNRLKTKAYISFETLISYWTAVRAGLTKFDNAVTQAAEIFNSASALFDGTQTYTDVDGNTLNYPKIIPDNEFLLDYYMDNYGERLVGKKLEIGKEVFSAPKGFYTLGTEEALSNLMDLIYKRVQQFVTNNSYKYLTLVRTTGFSYNPIENYRMVEEGQDDRIIDGTNSNVKTGSITETQNGSEDLTHTINAVDVGHISITGPVDSYTTTTDSNGQLKITAISINDRDKNDTETIARTSGTNAGGTIGTVSTGSSFNATIGINGDPVQTKNYTTTYDDDTEGRLNDYSVNSGTTGSAEMESRTTSSDEIMTGTIESGTPSAYGYTDSKTFNGRTNETTFNSVTDSGKNSSTDNNVHKLTRSGNIGVTTSQQMIQSERELANFNIIKDFCEELNKEILLGLWNQKSVSLKWLSDHTDKSND